MTPAAAAPSRLEPSLPAASRIDPTQLGLFQDLLDRSPGPDGSSVKGKDRAQEPTERRKKAPSLDPTAAASAELVSSGPVKPAVAEAQAVQSQGSQPGPKPESRATAARMSSTPIQASGGQSSPGREVASVAAQRDQGQHALQQKPGLPSPKPAPAPAPTAERRATPVAGVIAKSGENPAQKAGQTRSAQPLAALSRGGAVRVVGAPRATATAIKPVAIKPKTAPQRAPAHEDAAAAQFGRGLAAALRQNGGTVTLRLQPEALGDLKIRMSLEPGKVKADFEVQTEQARKLLGSSMDSLRSALEAQGLAVARLDVQVAEPPCPVDGGQNFGGADAHGGRAGSEDPGPGTGDAARTPHEAEPNVEQRPRTGQESGGAPRLDALA